MKDILLIIIGFILAHVPGIFDRRRKLKTHWYAIRAEMLLSREKAEALLIAGIAAPLYRLPVIAYTTSFPILLSEGAVSEEEALQIGRCFAQIQDINRGLDYASEMNTSGNEEKLKQEYNRNCLKAKALLLGDEGKVGLFEPAKKIVDSKIETSWFCY